MKISSAKQAGTTDTISNDGETTGFQPVIFLNRLQTNHRLEAFAPGSQTAAVSGWLRAQDFAGHAIVGFAVFVEHLTVYD
jgi:hypothetical protein